MRHLRFKHFALTSLFAFGLTSVLSAQSQLAGEWKGALDAGGTTYHVAWHVSAGSDGSMTSTFDNMDQGLFGVKAKSTVLKDSTVTVLVDDVAQVQGQSVPIKGTFTGTLNPSANRVEGTWKQAEPEGPAAPLILERVETPRAAASKSVAGDWLGSLAVQGAELRLALHIQEGKDGGLSATLDSIDQGVNGIPVTEIAWKESKLHMSLDSIHGIYDAALNADASVLEGTWSQGQPLPLTFKRGVAPPPAAAAAPSDIDGTWSGVLEAGSMKLRILLRLKNTTEGLSAELQSPDQNPGWAPATSVTRSGATLSINFKAFGAVYEGKIGADLKAIDGAFTQMGNTMPLKLKRGES